jgi:hypothetical protein
MTELKNQISPHAMHDLGNPCTTKAAKAEAGNAQIEFSKPTLLKAEMLRTRRFGDCGVYRNLPLNGAHINRNDVGIPDATCRTFLQAPQHIYQIAPPSGATFAGKLTRHRTSIQ